MMARVCGCCIPIAASYVCNAQKLLGGKLDVGVAVVTKLVLPDPVLHMQSASVAVSVTASLRRR